MIVSTSVCVRRPTQLLSLHVDLAAELFTILPGFEKVLTGFKDAYMYSNEHSNKLHGTAK